METTPVSEWMAIDQWHQCRAMERPGIAFELQNADGQQMLSRCSDALPATPFDWGAPPIRFRAVVEPPPKRSAPIPEPKG